MRIFQFDFDVDRYQMFYFDGPEDVIWFNGDPMRDVWVPPKVHILEPRLKRGNFLFLQPGMMVVDERARTELAGFLEPSGELLPFDYKGERFWALNVTTCIDALDEDRTEWQIGQTTGARIGIERYAFHAHRLTGTPIFKIPETSRAYLYTMSGWKDPEDEFVFNVQKRGLKGLRFDEVWSDDS